MHPETNSIYQSPSSSLEVNPMGLQDLPYLSTWWVLLFSICTLNTYPLYWLFQRSTIVNGIFPENLISPIFMIPLAVLWITSFAADLVTLFFPLPYWNDEISTVISLVVGIGVIVWAFMVRSRLHQLFIDENVVVRIGSVMTFLFGALYLSYKINEAKNIHDQQQ